MLVPVICFTAIFVACAVVVVRAFVRLGRQLSLAGEQVARFSTRLEETFLPGVEAVITQATAIGHEIEAIADTAASVSGHLDEAMASLGDLTLMVEEAVQPIASAAAAVGIDRRRTRAVRAAIGAFFGRLLGRRR